jgi:hypothetical protein
MEHAEPAREYGCRLGVQSLYEDPEDLPGGIGRDGLSVSYNVAPRLSFRYDIGNAGRRIFADKKGIAGENKKTAALNQ